MGGAANRRWRAGSLCRPCPAAWRPCDDRRMTATLRIELFVADLDACVDFYARVLRFGVVQDERTTGYVFLRRDAVKIGAVLTADSRREFRRPPMGIEIVFEVDDVERERDAVAASWVLDEDLVDRPWGLRDFRIIDPDGYLLRVTNR